MNSEQIQVNCVYAPVDVLQLHIRNSVELVFLEIYFLSDREDARNVSNLHS